METNRLGTHIDNPDAKAQLLSHRSCERKIGSLERRQLDTKRVAKLMDCGFTHIVGRLEGHRQYACGAPDVDDAPPARGNKEWEELLHHRDRSPDVQFKEGARRSEIHVGDSCFIG